MLVKTRCSNTYTKYFNTIKVKKKKTNIVSVPFYIVNNMYNTPALKTKTTKWFVISPFIYVCVVLIIEVFNKNKK